jgi:hypothetical protein
MHSQCGGSSCGGNNPDCETRDSRDSIVREKLKEQDDREAMATADARGLTLSLLTEKGFSEIEQDPSFDIESSGTMARVSTDFIVRVNGKPFMAVKCSMALVSRERHILSFARAAIQEIIPFAVITDGLNAHLLDTATGRLISEDSKDIPDREKASEMLAGITPQSLPEERLKREKMVLLAFESASCPPARPADSTGS